MKDICDLDHFNQVVDREKSPFHQASNLSHNPMNEIKIISGRRVLGNIVSNRIT